MEPNKEQILQRNQKVIDLHNNLVEHIGSIYDLWIRESSNSRRTNLKRLNGWKLTKVENLRDFRDGLLTFTIEIESKKGIHKHQFGDDVVKYILRG